MQPPDRAPPPPLPAPPPYRTPAWFDPRQQHLPCQCPRCRAAHQPRPRRMLWRISLVVLGGVALPLISLAINASMHVVQLGALGTALICFTVASVIAHLLFAPRRPDPETLALVAHYPRGVAARLALLAAAGLSCVTWGYLGLLFLPLIPLSLLLVALLGLGLCGLAPYAALSIAILHLCRGYRAVRDARGRGLAVAALLGSLVLPLAVAGGAAIFVSMRHGAIERRLALIERTPQHSARRMQLVATLAGDEQQLLAIYARATDHERQRTIAAVYHRLTDDTLQAGALREHVPGRGPAMLRPFAFLQGRPVLDGFFGPLTHMPWLR